MKLFDRIQEDNQDEVELRSSAPEKTSEPETRLGEDVEEKLDTAASAGGDGASAPSPGSSASGSTGVDLPGMDSGNSSGAGTAKASSSVSVEDVHEQNKQIISLLEDIKSEVGGGGSELL